MEKRCLQCNKVFSSIKQSHKFCSIKCGQLFHNLLRPHSLTSKKECLCCKNTFSTNKSFKIFCSRQCKINYNSLLRARNPQYKLICPTCKKNFIADRKDKEFCSKHCLWKSRNDKKIRLTSKSYFKADELRTHHIPQNQLEIIYGTLLGDGSLILQTNNFHRLSLCHCEKQLDYLLFKKEKLKSIFIQQNPNKYIHKAHFFGNNHVKEKIQYHLHSISHKELTNIYGIFHKNKKKYLTRKGLNLLTPTSLLFWYLDDGSLSKQRSIILSTLSFSLSEHQAMKKWFWQKYKIEAKISTSRVKYNDIPKTYNYLRFNVYNTKKFIDLISTSSFFNELPACMNYKFNIRPYIND